MKDQFVTYEIAKKLKELGFNESCLGDYYERDGKFELVIYGEFRPDTVEWMPSPLWQQAIDWLRTEHGIYVAYVPKSVHNFSVESNAEYIGTSYGGTHEQSMENAILKAIEFIKN